MARQLLLIRHASVPDEYAGQFLGRSDVPLGDKAAGQIRNLMPLLRRRQPGKLVSSPLRRARETADGLATEMRLAAEVDADLREIDFGLWEEKTFAQISAGWPDEVARWAEFNEEFAFPGGESIGGFLQRIRLAADRLAGDEAEVVAAVTHGGVVRAMICYLLGLSYRQYLLFDVRHAACATIDLFDGKGVLRGLNDPSLEG